MYRYIEGKVKKKRGWEEEGNEVVLYFGSDQDLIPKLFHEWRGRKARAGWGHHPTKWKLQVN